MLKTIGAALLALSLLGAPLAAWAQEAPRTYTRTDEGAIMVDLLVMRPIGLLGVVAGLVLYLPASLVQSIGGNPVEPLADVLIQKPVDFTFKRPLGQIDIID